MSGCPFPWLFILSRGESSHFLSGCSSSTSCLVFHFLSGCVLHFQGRGRNPSTWGIDSLSIPGAFDGGLIPAFYSFSSENESLTFQQRKSEERCFIVFCSICHFPESRSTTFLPSTLSSPGGRTHDPMGFSLTSPCFVFYSPLFCTKRAGKYSHNQPKLPRIRVWS